VQQRGAAAYRRSCVRCQRERPLRAASAQHCVALLSSRVGAASCRR
jgi:hypothetical protein